MSTDVSGDVSREESPDLVDRRIGPVTVLFGKDGGKYPDGNTLLVEGSRETVLIDPALGTAPRRGRLPRVDRLLFSHCHEDHIAGAHLYPDVPWHVHEADVAGFGSLDAMMEIYGYPEPFHTRFRQLVVERFNYRARPDATAFGAETVFDLGGGVRIEAIHAPGHTRGHSCFLVRWEERDFPDSPGPLLYLGDIELTSFGPYYGDAWSNLEDFRRTLDRVRDIDARYYATFHHIGVLEGREAYLERFERFAGKISDRESRLLEYLAEPHDIDDIARHRFVYRPGDDVPIADPVERRSMGMHLEGLVASGQVEQLADGRYRRKPSATEGVSSRREA